MTTSTASDATKIDPLAVTAPDLSSDAITERSFDLNKLFTIAGVRESPWPQFDGMGYMKYNETNEMADMSFIAPKKNRYDTRVTSGVTHEKDSSIVALVQSFNFETNVTIFYKEKMLNDLSVSCTAWIRKAREIMLYDEMRPINYRNIVVQGTAFADVKRVQQFVPNKIISSEDALFTDPDSVEWQTVGLKKHFDGTMVTLMDGKKVFLEDIHQQDIRKQPGVYSVEYIPREVLESIWGQSPMWQHIPKRSGPNGTVGSMLTDNSIYSEWFYMPVGLDKIEVIVAQRPFDNRIQMYFNSVPMLKVGFPLTAVSPSGLPTIAKGDIDPMNMFAYSKGVPAKTKMDQAMYDALLRVSLISFQQQIMPPIGNNTGKLLSPDIFMPGKQTRDVQVEQISKLLENPGLTQSSFQFINMIKEQIDNKSISSMLENGTMPEGQMTLGQYMDQQKRQLIKLGGIFDGIINWEKQIAHLIFMDLLANGAEEGKSVSMSDTFSDGATGTRVLRFKSGITDDSDALHQEELDTQKQTGQDIRYSDMDPAQLKAMIDDPDFYIYYEVVPVDKNNDKISQAFFVSTIGQAMELFGPQSLKVENLKQEFAHLFGKQFDDLFLSQGDMQLQQQQAVVAQQNAGQPANPAQNNAAPTAPGINMPMNNTLIPK